MKLILVILLTLTGCYSDIAILNAVNSEINAVPYVSDQKNYGKNDYLATPEEFYANGGDCEDYARAKYEKLLTMGFSFHQFSYVIANDKINNIQHAMLALQDKGKWYIFDNNINLVADMRYLVTRYNNAIFIPIADFK